MGRKKSEISIDIRKLTICHWKCGSSERKIGEIGNVSLVPTACGLAIPRVARGSYSWTVEFEKSRRSYGGDAWLCKYLGSARVRGCIGAVWPLPFLLTCELFTAIMRETTDALTSPRTTSILPVPTTGNNANRGRNSWKDRPLERSLKLGIDGYTFLLHLYQQLVWIPLIPVDKFRQVIHGCSKTHYHRYDTPLLLLPPD
ncbi:hypothetical protein AVEN_101621-1 [Araneus ventricosus]|uniref:Uncharacterized protein n=1 Tax=Araneus ventricosus TaxID=182803 RepID=A0A4Y2EZI6_ARAVE|nr:hypothetical protein AVEN_101621-1 [Araneus ventricosus]